MSTLADLIAALRELSRLDPIERARRTPQLIGTAKRVLADVRSEAIAEAVANGQRQADVARALGVSRTAISGAIRRRTDSEETQ